MRGHANHRHKSKQREAKSAVLGGVLRQSASSSFQALWRRKTLESNHGDTALENGRGGIDLFNGSRETRKAKQEKGGSRSGKEILDDKKSGTVDVQRSGGGGGYEHSGGTFGGVGFSQRTQSAGLHCPRRGRVMD